MNKNLKKLKNRVLDAQTSERAIALVQEIAATHDPEAIIVLSRLMDTPGVVGKAVVKALVSFGPSVIPTMRKRLNALDEDVIRNAYRVLGAFGDLHAREMARAVCWADVEERETAAADVPMAAQ